MAEALRKILETYGEARIRISAQSYLERFYSEFGFVARGPESGGRHTSSRNVERGSRRMQPLRSIDMRKTTTLLLLPFESFPPVRSSEML